MAKKGSAPARLEDLAGSTLVRVEEIRLLPGENPNHMTEEQERLLEASVRRFGWRQPLALVREGTQFWLADGAHRLQLAKKLGMPAVPALVKDGTVEEARAERLGLNRIRGTVDLGLATDELASLQNAGWALPDLEATGFTQDELDVLLAAAAAPDVLVEAQEAELEPQEEQTKRYALKLVFDREEDRDRVKLRLLEAGPTAEAGLLTLLG